MDPLAVRREGAAELLSISLRQFVTLNTSGRLGPRSVSLMGAKVWSVAELKRWVDAGMPPRNDWTGSDMEIDPPIDAHSRGNRRAIAPNGVGLRNRDRTKPTTT